METWQPHQSYGYELKAKPPEALTIEEKAKLMFAAPPELPKEVVAYLNVEQTLYKTKQALKQLKAVKKFLGSKTTRKRKRSEKPSSLIRTKTNQLAESVQSFFASETPAKKEEIAQFVVSEAMKKAKKSTPPPSLLTRSRSRIAKVLMTKEIADRYLAPTNKTDDPVALLNQRNSELSKQKINLTHQLRQLEQHVESWLKQQPKQEFLLQNGKLKLKTAKISKPRSIAMSPTQFKASIAVGLMRANMKDPKTVKPTVEAFADYVTNAQKLQKMEIAKT